MKFEAMEQYEKALKKYEEILEEDETNAVRFVFFYLNNTVKYRRFYFLACKEAYYFMFKITEQDQRVHK